MLFIGIEPMPGNRRKRLEKLEQKLGDLVRKEALANCNCLKRVFVGSTEKLEAEMNKICPAHGFRRLGQITIVSIGTREWRESTGQIDESQGLQQLIEEYHRRLDEVEQAEEEQEYGWREN